MAKQRLNTERLLLTTLVAVAFFGFTMWSIAQFSSETESLYSSDSILNISVAKNRYLKVSAPTVDQKVKNPLTVSGQSFSIAGPIKIRLKDANLTLVEKTLTISKGANFSTILKYNKPTATKGTLEVFQLKDGAELYKLSIPVSF